MKKHFIKCRTVLGIVMIVSIILFPINAYGGQQEEIEALQAEQNAHNEAAAEENRKEVEAAAAEKVAAQMAAIEETKAAAVLAQEQNEAIAAANREAVEAAVAEKVAAQMAAMEGTDSQEEAVEEKHSEKQADEKKEEVFIEELIESANIEGRSWLDWSPEELKDYDSWNEYDTYKDENISLYADINDETSHYIGYAYQNDKNINNCGTHVSWYVYEEDNRILNYIYSWGSQSYLQGDKDYSDGWGFLGYMYEKKCTSIEDLLTLWNMEKADPKFMEAYEAGEDYSTTLLTEYGETEFHMLFEEDGNRIDLLVGFPRENDEDDEGKVPYGLLTIGEQKKEKDKEFSIHLMLLSTQ